jgi:spore maturation protein CgeB
LSESLRLVFCGLSLSSSWGNGHATTYRGLLKELRLRGHSIVFLERDVSWYRDNRDLPASDFCELSLYQNLEELESSYSETVRDADVVVVGSYTPDGIAVGHWVQRTALGLKVFYDIDTPVTLAQLNAGSCTYLSPDLIPDYDLYLSFTGGPTLEHIERHLGSPCARVLYCSVDPSKYFPQTHRTLWDLGYLGTYSVDRQPKLDALLLQTAIQRPESRFAVAGAQYPPNIEWPQNVERVDHIPPEKHRQFYNSQRFTLNVTRSDMVIAGYSPGVRLFEAAACGVPIISDYWHGLDSIFRTGSEIFVAATTSDTLQILAQPPEVSLRVAERARERVLREHTSSHRALEFERYVRSLLDSSRGQRSDGRQRLQFYS